MPLVTLDIQDSCIKLLVTNGKRVKKWGDADLPDGLVKDGVVTDPPVLATYIKALLRKQASSRGKLALCLSGVRYIPRVFAVPKLKKHLQQEAIWYESERRMPVPLEQLHLTWQRLDGDGLTDRYFVVGVSQRSITSLVETLVQAGIKNYSLDFKPVALARSVNAREAVVLNVEQGNADIVLVADGVPEIIRSVRVDPDPDAREDALEEIGVEVIRTVDYYNSTHADRPLDPEAPVFLTGSLARDAVVQALMNKLLGDRLTSVDFPLDSPPDLPSEEYSANIGIALGRAAALAPAMTIGVNWQGYRPPGHFIRNVLATAMTALALASLVPLSEIRTQALSETGLLEQELVAMKDQLRERVKSNASLENVMLESDQLREERQTVLGSENGVVDKLSSIFQGLPVGMAPDSLTLTGDALILDGRADHISQVIGFTSQLEDTGLFSAVYLESLSPPGANGENDATTFEIRAQY